MADSFKRGHVSAQANDPDIGPIVPHFVARLPAQAAKLQALVATGNAEELRKLLHQLRGAGKSLGFARMTEMAAEPEEELLAGKGMREAGGPLEALVEYIEQVDGYAG